MRKPSSGVAIATAAALLFGVGLASTAAAAEGGKIECHGVNACKGQSACKGAHNSCKGQNSCKGKGYLEMTKEECAAAKAKMKEGAK